MSAISLPITFRASPLPPKYRATPQQFLDDLVARLAIDTEDSISFFYTGSTLPTSNVGPFLLDGKTWYVWSDDSGAYVPQVIAQESLKYSASSTPPDHEKYLFWIKLNGDGKALGVYYYYDGAWVDVYADVFSGIQSKIDDLKTYPAAAKLSAAQTIPVDTVAHKVAFGSIVTDPSTIYDGGNARYTCAVKGIYRVNANLQLDNDGAAAATMEIGISVYVNELAPVSGPTSGDSTPNPNGARWYPQVGGLIQCEQGDTISIWLSANDTVNAGNLTVAPQSQFYVELVQKLT